MTVPTTEAPAPDFRLKAHDTLPVIEARLGYEGSQTGPNLAGARVNFIMRPLRGGAAKVNARATIASASTRTVRYSWRAGDTDTPGLYLAEWEVHDALGGVQTFPTTSYHLIEILADLDVDGTEVP